MEIKAVITGEICRAQRSSVRLANVTEQMEFELWQPNFKVCSLTLQLINQNEMLGEVVEKGEKNGDRNFKMLKSHKQEVSKFLFN